jgi:hypothetical protein
MIDRRWLHSSAQWQSSRLRMRSNNKMEYSKAPLVQKAFKIMMWTLGGILALGVVLDSVANAISLLTPLIASIGTACIVLVWVLAHIILPSHPLYWVVGTQRVRVTKLGIQPKAFAVGMILLLWIPSVIAQWQPLSRPADTVEDRPVQLHVTLEDVFDKLKAHDASFERDPRVARTFWLLREPGASIALGTCPGPECFQFILGQLRTGGGVLISKSF